MDWDILFFSTNSQRNWKFVFLRKNFVRELNYWLLSRISQFQFSASIASIRKRKREDNEREKESKRARTLSPVPPRATSLSLPNSRRLSSSISLPTSLPSNSNSDNLASSVSSSHSSQKLSLSHSSTFSSTSSFLSRSSLPSRPLVRSELELRNFRQVTMKQTRKRREKISKKVS
jgi:hypothetical protein